MLGNARIVVVTQLKRGRGRMMVIEQVVCLIRGHDWRFSYNHGIPLGDNRPYSEVEEGFKSGKAYRVSECRRCKSQSRILDGKLVILKRSEMEEP